jgi:hypothetical protein
MLAGGHAGVRGRLGDRLDKLTYAGKWPGGSPCPWGHLRHAARRIPLFATHLLHGKQAPLHEDRLNVSCRGAMGRARARLHATDTDEDATYPEPRPAPFPRRPRPPSLGIGRHPSDP